MNILACGIDLNGTVSAAVQVPIGESLQAISSPGQFTGATFGLEVSFDNGVTWLTVNQLGSADALAVGINIAAGCYIPIPPEIFMVPAPGYSMLVRITCTAQAAARSLAMHFW